jgi:hypothetical protein
MERALARHKPFPSPRRRSSTQKTLRARSAEYLLTDKPRDGDAISEVVMLPIPAIATGVVVIVVAIAVVLVVLLVTVSMRGGQRRAAQRRGEARRDADDARERAERAEPDR